MTFRGRLRIFFAIIVAVPMMGIGAVLFSLATDSERGKTDAGLATGMRVALTDYARAHKASERELRRIAGDPALIRVLGSGDKEAIAARLRALSARDDVVQATLLSPDGQELARAGSRSGFGSASADVSDGEGRRLGSLVIAVRDGRGLVKQARSQTQFDYMALRGGNAIASTVPEVETAPRGSGDFDAGGREYRGRRERAGRVGVTDEEIAVFQEAADLNSAIRDRRILIGAILVAFIVLALASSVFVVRALQDEIGRFLSAARRLASGHFDQPVEVTGDDEFAQLAREFNSMSSQLEQKIGEVERKRDELEQTIRRVGAAFATGLDQQGIFDLTIETAVDACEADAGRGLPLDLRLLAEVRAGEATPEINLALEEAERLALTVRPETGRQLLEVEQDRAAPPEQPAPTGVERDGVHALALPLRARLGTRAFASYVGAFSIARAGDEFTPQEAELLRYLAGQAVVSIENADLHEVVQRQAVTDELTGLANVRELHGALDREFDRRRRFETPLGFILLDIDNFKQVNDTFGHQQGDEVLIEVARVLKDRSRDIDEPARYGGEEMAVVLPQTDVEGAALLAERMREAIEALRVPRLDGQGEMQVTASFGVSSAPASATDKDGLIAAADAALYRAKRTGKNKVVRADPVVA